MRVISRRAALAGAAAVVPGGLPGLVTAQPVVNNWTRHGAHTPEGKAMLRIYAEGVAIMRDTSRLPPTNPRSWTFQWYTHAVRSDTSKSAELQRLYPAASAERQQANLMWNTCAPHNPVVSQYPAQMHGDFFLPWHRMYVLYLEQIIRELTGKPQFSLPYWDYTSADIERQKIPEEFTKENDSVFGALYLAQRRQGVNARQSIQGKPNTLNLDAMSRTSYSPTAIPGSPGPLHGFCSSLDRSPHGAVHVNVGLPGPVGANPDVGMASVPWAANDPIFWLHHCNIDRIWASWSKAGGSAPGAASFRNTVFNFVDGTGMPVRRPVGEVLETDALRYNYDEYLDRPAGSPAFPAAPLVAGVGAAPVVLAAAPAGTLALGGGTSIANLAARALPGVPVAAAAALGSGETRSSGATRWSGRLNPSLTGNLESRAADRDVYLLLGNIQTHGPMVGGYDVYLDLPPGAVASRGDTSFVGSINFFGAADHAGGHASARGTDASFRVTDIVRRLRGENRLQASPNVRLVPVEEAGSGTTATIGSVSLISL